MEVLEDKKNELLHRTELVLSMESAITPSKEQAIKMISEQFKTPEESIVIKKIGGKFGIKTSVINAKIYSNPESRKRFEVIPRKTRKKAKEAEAKPAEGAK